jgi:hypothetical protein
MHVLLHNTATTLRGDTASSICTVAVCRVRSIDKRWGNRAINLLRQSPPEWPATSGLMSKSRESACMTSTRRSQRPRDGQQRQRLVAPLPVG